jgi:hypothetical protein
MRFSIDPLRADSTLTGLSLSHVVLLAGLPLEMVWFGVSWKAFYKGNSVLKPSPHE